MNKKLYQKLLSVFLAALTLLGTGSVVISADEAGTAGETAVADKGGDDGAASYPGYYDGYTSLEDVKKYMGIQSYDEYKRRYANEPRATQTVTIMAADYDAASTTAAVEVREKGSADCDSTSLYMPETGKTVWKVTVPETGKYAIRVTYYACEGSFTTIERMLYIDGKLPFSESRYYYFPRSWSYEYDSYDDAGNPLFEVDVNGNDVRPRRNESPEWTTYYLRDWLGYTMEPFEFYLTEGEHTLELEGSREPMVISSIELYPYEEEMSYADFIAKCKEKGITEVTGVDPVVIEAENPAAVSNACLFPANDRTSSLTTPQDPAVIKYNMIDSSVVNQWMKYEVTVPKSGLYYIACRYRQNSLIGMFTSRRIYINNEVQFDEANNIRFPYSPEWQSKLVTDGYSDGYLFYLEEGKNVIQVEVVLGQMTEYVYRVEQMIDRLNSAYQKLLLIFGTTPDSIRDYGIGRIAPDAIKIIGDAADELFAMAKELQEVTGELGDQVQTLNTIALLFERMANDEDEIAPNFITYKNYIIALSNWLYATLSQPLKVDKYVVLCSDDLKSVPQAKSNFFQAAWFEIKAFVMSFFMDYTTIGYQAGSENDAKDSIEMWIVSAGGREDALIQRYLVDNYFTPNSNITMTIKVISAGLTEAILAGIGPDISNMSSNDTITWGMRNAVQELSEKNADGTYKYEGFDEVMTWFDPSATAPLTMDGKTYGIPASMSFYMMFYRSDVLAEYGLEAPRTWEELETVVLPALMKGHLEVGMPTSLVGTEIFLYQMGQTVYSEEEGHKGWKVNLDVNTSLAAFEKLMNFFTKYGSKVSYDITRFRTGEIPIIIADAIGTYNTLMSFYELRGLWEMAPLPGMEQEDGTLNRSSIVTVSSYVIPRNSDETEKQQRRYHNTWEYIKWQVSEETQLRQAKETLNVNANPTTKYNTANINALKKLAWTADEKEALNAQLEQLASVPEYPGNYIVNVYVNNAFMDVYNNNTNPIDAMLDRILDMNKEISRKRKEFHLDYYEIGSGN